jgi:hypothetical protein
VRFSGAKLKSYAFAPLVPLLDVAWPRRMVSITSIFISTPGLFPLSAIRLLLYLLPNPGNSYTAVIAREFYRVRDPVTGYLQQFIFKEWNSF